MPVWPESETGNEEVQSMHRVRLSPSALQYCRSTVTHSTRRFLVAVMQAKHLRGEGEICFDLPISNKDLKCLRRVSQHDVIEHSAHAVSQGHQVMCLAATLWAKKGFSSGRSKPLSRDSAGKHHCWQKRAAELAYEGASWVCFTAHWELVLFTWSIRELSMCQVRKQEESFSLKNKKNPLPLYFLLKGVLNNLGFGPGKLPLLLNIACLFLVVLHICTYSTELCDTDTSAQTAEVDLCSENLGRSAWQRGMLLTNVWYPLPCISMYFWTGLIVLSFTDFPLKFWSCCVRSSVNKSVLFLK